MLINQAIRYISDLLNRYNLPNHTSEARLIVSHYTGIPHLELELQREKKLPAETWQKISACIERRCLHEPLQYIFGEVSFAGLDFYVDPSVLIPRPETELLLERILKDYETIPAHQRVLDIGTGSGVIAVGLKKFRPEWQVEATDLSKTALKIARQNARRNRTEIVFHQTDLYPEIEKRVQNWPLYDIIVSNPPYIPADEYRELNREIREYEPCEALLARENGFYFYRRILERAASFLQPEGRIYLEIGYNQGEGIRELARQFNYRVIDMHSDYQQFERIVSLALK
jgi:release factor glutamine methyltransferase